MTRGAFSFMLRFVVFSSCFLELSASKASGEARRAPRIFSFSFFALIYLVLAVCWWNAFIESKYNRIGGRCGSIRSVTSNPGGCLVVQVYGGTAEQLKAYRVGVTPPENNWVEVEDAVFFQQVRPLACADRHGTLPLLPQGNGNIPKGRQVSFCVHVEGPFSLPQTDSPRGLLAPAF